MSKFYGKHFVIFIANERHFQHSFYAVFHRSAPPTLFTLFAPFTLFTLFELLTLLTLLTGFIQCLQHRKDEEGLEFDWVSDDDGSIDKCFFVFKNNQFKLFFGMQ